MGNIGYVALYRKYRPLIFSEVVGQEHVTITLENQVKNDKVAHAYLFCGPRGTGKTSAAKILSRSINCLDNHDGSPCNDCNHCKGILDGSIMDVIEIDAASNNSVDNIRNIRDEVIYSPSKTKYKVYIIDEVHMLSTGAFNALLKTLEEPPGHVIFILATTEPHKLLPTIISRCQRFDFKRIGIKDILKRLKIVCDEIGLKIEEKALELIASICDGGLRDALSILDQSVSLGKQTITHQDIMNMVGIVDSKVLIELSQFIKNSDITSAIKIINNVFYDGKDLNHFMIKMINYYRNLLMIKVMDNVDNVVDLSHEDILKMKEIISDCSQHEIINTIEVISNTLSESKKTDFSKVLLETAIIKLCNKRNINSNLDLTEILDRISKLENSVNKGSFKLESKQIVKEDTLKSKVTEMIQKDEDCPSVLSEDSNSLADNISNNWNNVLADMSQKGFTPIKLQFLNNILIKPLSDSTVIGYIEYKQDIYAKMLEDKKLTDALMGSISKIVGKNINLKIKSKKLVDNVISEIDSFKELVQNQGMQNLINEI